MVFFISCAFSLALVGQTHREFPHDDVKNAPNPVPIQKIDAWQTGPYCGANSLYLMLSLRGITTSPEKVRKAVSTTEQGASLLQLKNAAKKYGLPTEVLEVRPVDLRDQPLPFIALIGQTDVESLSRGHYLVIVGFRDRFVEALDGTSANLLSIEDGSFNRDFSGYILVATGAPSASGFEVAVKWLTAIEAVVLSCLICVWGVTRFRARFVPLGDQ